MRRCRKQAVMKICVCCGKTKSIIRFPRVPDIKGAPNNICTECEKKEFRKGLTLKRRKKQASDKKYHVRRNKRHIIIVAIRNGLIKREHSCKICGVTSDKTKIVWRNVIVKFTNYIIWVCESCARKFNSRLDNSRSNAIHLFTPILGRQARYKRRILDQQNRIFRKKYNRRPTEQELQEIFYGKQ